VTVEALRQAWPTVVEAIKGKGRVAWMVIGNASVASFDEGVLTLRFPRQGDVKGFQGGKYEDLLKQVLNAMFGINVVVRAITGGGDAPSAARRPGPAPAAPSAPGSNGQPPASPYGQPPTPPYGQSQSGQSQSGQSLSGQSPPASAPPDYPQQGASSVTPGAVLAAGATLAPGGQVLPPGPGDTTAVAGPPPGSAVDGGGGSTHPFGAPVSSGGELPTVPSPPPADDEDFDPDDEDMPASTVHQLTGMALVQRELGGEIIAEYDD
jgi:DNA polymerase-3 subunit gamma/tau